MPDIFIAIFEELLKALGVKTLGHRGIVLRWFSILWFAVLEFLVFWNDALGVIQSSTDLQGGALLAATAYMNAGGRLLHVVTSVAYLNAQRLLPVLSICIASHWVFNLTIEYLFSNRTFANDLPMFGVLSLPLAVAILVSLPILAFMLHTRKPCQ